MTSALPALKLGKVKSLLCVEDPNVRIIVVNEDEFASLKNDVDCQYFKHDDDTEYIVHSQVFESHLDLPGAQVSYWHQDKLELAENCKLDLKWLENYLTVFPDGYSNR